MKRTFTSLALCTILGASWLSAATIDTSKAAVSFGAFKTAEKAKVGGTFDNIELKFGKDTKSIKGILTGATATIDTAKINLADEAKNANLTEFFFSQFKKDKRGKSLINVKFDNVIEGKEQGTILASVTMNGVSRKVPIQYTIKDRKLWATGTIDILDFALDKAYAKLIEGCGELHEGVTWTQVEIYFEAPIK